MTNAKKKTVIVIPAYNERENIQAVIQEALSLPIAYDLTVLVVDDNSPDRTGQIVRKMAEEDQRVHLLLRTKRRGRGAAGIDGFKEALRLNADYVIEMDGDFSHQPRFIPSLLENCEEYDVVIGSRFVRGGKSFDRGLLRKLVTFLVRHFIRYQYKTPVQDVSSGFRCFKRKALEQIDLDDLVSAGPSLVFEILYKITLLNVRIGEVPIIFIDRKHGRTKLSLLTLLETLLMALKFKKLYPPSACKDRP